MRESMHLQQWDIIQVSHHLIIPVTKQVVLIHIYLLFLSCISWMKKVFIFLKQNSITQKLNILHNVVMWVWRRTKKLRIRLKLKVGRIALLTTLHGSSFYGSWWVKLWFTLLQVTISAADHFPVVSYYSKGFLISFFIHFIANLFL